MAKVRSFLPIIGFFFRCFGKLLTFISNVANQEGRRYVTEISHSDGQYSRRATNEDTHTQAPCEERQHSTTYPNIEEQKGRPDERNIVGFSSEELCRDKTECCLIGAVLLLSLSLYSSYSPKHVLVSVVLVAVDYPGRTSEHVTDNISQ